MRRFSITTARLAAANCSSKIKRQTEFVGKGALCITDNKAATRSFDRNCRRQVVINIVSCILYKDDAVVLTLLHYRYPLAAVASERKEEGVKIVVLGFYRFDGVFLLQRSIK